MKRVYLIYISEEGHWEIPGKHRNKAAARRAYLRWAKRKRLPAGSAITRWINNQA